MDAVVIRDVHVLLVAADDVGVPAAGAALKVMVQENSKTADATWRARDAAIVTLIYVHFLLSTVAWNLKRKKQKRTK